MGVGSRDGSVFHIPGAQKVRLSETIDPPAPAVAVGTCQPESHLACDGKPLQVCSRTPSSAYHFLSEAEPASQQTHGQAGRQGVSSSFPCIIPDLWINKKQ